MRDAGRDRQHERLLGQRVGARLERRDDVAGLHRHDEDVGVGGRPGRARHDAHAGEAILEDPAAFGVDLGDRERVGLPAGRRRRPDGERFAHAAPAEEAHVHRVRLTVALTRSASTERVISARRTRRRTRRGPEERSGRSRTSPNGAASCTSGPHLRYPSAPPDTI